MVADRSSARTKGRDMVADRSSARTASSITAGDLARWLSVDLKTVHNWVRRGHLAGRRTQGGHRRFFRAEVVRFLRRDGRPIPEALLAPAPTVGRLPLWSSRGASAAARRSRLVSALAQLALDATAGRCEIVILDAGEPEAEDVIEILRALRSHHLTRGLCTVVVTSDEGVGPRFIEAGCDLCLGHEREVSGAVAWLTGWAEALATPSPAEHLGPSFAAQSASRSLDRGEPSQLAPGLESVC